MAGVNGSRRMDWGGGRKKCERVLGEEVRMIDG